MVTVTVSLSPVTEAELFAANVMPALLPVTVSPVPDRLSPSSRLLRVIASPLPSTVRVAALRAIVEVLVERVSPVPVTSMELPFGSVTEVLLALIVMVIFVPSSPILNFDV